VRYAHTVAQVRAAEAPLLAAQPPRTLMLRAATGLAVACADVLGRVYGARVLLLVGPGGNGADALFAGAWLARRGAQLTAVLAGDLGEDGQAGLAALRRAGGRVGEVGPADLVLDGLVGIGARGGLRRAMAELVDRVDGPVVAVDLPSGVDADTGAVEGAAVQADLTVTFGTLKPGLLVGEGRERAGRVHLVELGLDLPPAPVELLEAPDVAALLPQAGSASDKYTRGVLGVAAGSPQYTGAAVLAVGAALAAGAGMVRFAGADHPAEQVRLRWPEAVVTPFAEAGRVQAWVVGPGLGTDDVAESVVAEVLASDVPVLVDADALTVCARRQDLLRGRGAPTLLTPHDREFARFFLAGGEHAGTAAVGADRIGAARALAADLGVHVLLKGAATVVVGPGGPARVNPTGSPVLATAGSGDVLSGGAGALLAQGLDPLDAGSVAAYLHGVAGALSADGATTSAGGVLEHWRAAVRTVLFP
jgi:hydroxyethylthiazole kinase-like uncharacterized protein yjeF